MGIKAAISRKLRGILGICSLDEKIVASADDVDLAMVFGTGFAPFRGGPLRYADSVGINNIVQKLDRLAADRPRFAPCERLRRMAAAAERFHPADAG